MERELESLEAAGLLSEIERGDVLELHPGSQDGQILIPYFMNDACEYYLCLFTARLHGQIPFGALPGAKVLLQEGGEGKKALFIRLVSGEVLSIWCERICLRGQVYRYHLIGHGWREGPEEAHIRRMVNLLSVLKERERVLGRESLSETERFLAELIGFGPLRAFSPVRESILDWYEETERGKEAMICLSELAGDRALGSRLKRYRGRTLTGKLPLMTVQKLSRELAAPAHAALFEKLEELLRESSMPYPERDYGERANRDIGALRLLEEEKMKRAGFWGSYPSFCGRDKDGGEVRILYAEEQPFTVMESEQGGFCLYRLTIKPDQNQTIRMERAGALKEVERHV